MQSFRLALVCALLGFAVETRADGLRCGQRVVEVGESLAEVGWKCGPPAAQDRLRERGSNGAASTIDIWTYDFGPKSFVRILRFVDGRLRSVETGGYGR